MYLHMSYLFFGLLLSFTWCQVSEGRLYRSTASHWGYGKHNGPNTWGSFCNTGRKQSPVNIKLGKAIVANFEPFKFGLSYFEKHEFNIKNNGHTIQLSLQNNTMKPTVFGGGLERKYIFQQLHFHWESEHAFDGKRADLEMHLVHYNAKYRSFEEASNKSDGIAVFAILFDKLEDQKGDKIDDFFNYITDSLLLARGQSSFPLPVNLVPTYSQNIEFDDEHQTSFSLRGLLPKDVSRYYRYDGSLTTPTCDEVVQWTVFINRFFVSNYTLEAFRKIRDADNNLLVQNYRPPQSLYGRKVFIQLGNQYVDDCDPDDNEIDGCNKNPTSGGRSNNYKTRLILFLCYLLSYLIIHEEFTL